MTRLMLALAPVLTLAAAATAQAPAAIRVTLAAPVAQDGTVQAQVTRWTCVGASCTGPAINARLGDARACREIAKVTGTIAAYEGTRGVLAADDLAKCNKSAKRS